MLGLKSLFLILLSLGVIGTLILIIFSNQILNPGNAPPDDRYKSKNESRGTPGNLKFVMLDERSISTNELSKRSIGVSYTIPSGQDSLHDSAAYREFNFSDRDWSSYTILEWARDDFVQSRLVVNPIELITITGYLATDGSLYLARCDNSCTLPSNWSLIDKISTLGILPSETSYRPFDIAFEQSSGKLVIVYDKGLTETNDFYFRTYDPTSNTLSAEGAVNYIGSWAPDFEKIQFFKIAARQESNELTMLLSDATNREVYAFVWDSSSSTFPLEDKLTLASHTTSILLDPIGVAYEGLSGASVVFVGNGSNGGVLARWFDDSWSLIYTDSNPLQKNTVTQVLLSAEPDSDLIMLCVSDTLLDISCTVVDGGIMGRWSLQESNLDFVGVRGTSFDFKWFQKSKGLLVWTKSDKFVAKIWGDGVWTADATIEYANMGIHGIKQIELDTLTDSSYGDIANSTIMMTIQHNDSYVRSYVIQIKEDDTHNGGEAEAFEEYAIQIGLIGTEFRAKNFNVIAKLATHS